MCTPAYKHFLFQKIVLDPLLNLCFLRSDQNECLWRRRGSHRGERGAIKVLLTALQWNKSPVLIHSPDPYLKSNPLWNLHENPSHRAAWIACSTVVQNRSTTAAVISMLHILKGGVIGNSGMLAQWDELQPWCPYKQWQDKQCRKLKKIGSQLWDLFFLRSLQVLKQFCRRFTFFLLAFLQSVKA